MDTSINKARRNILKLALIGGGIFVVSKVLVPLFGRIANGPSVEHDLENFKTVENKNGLTVYDKSGQEIFVMDDKKE